MSSTATSNPVVNILERFCVVYTPFKIMFLMFLFFLSSYIYIYKTVYITFLRGMLDLSFCKI